MFLNTCFASFLAAAGRTPGGDETALLRVSAVRRSVLNERRLSRRRGGSDETAEAGESTVR